MDTNVPQLHAWATLTAREWPCKETEAVKSTSLLYWRNSSLIQFKSDPHQLCFYCSAAYVVSMAKRTFLLFSNKSQRSFHFRKLLKRNQNNKKPERSGRFVASTAMCLFLFSQNKRKMSFCERETTIRVSERSLSALNHIILPDVTNSEVPFSVSAAFFTVRTSMGLCSCKDTNCCKQSKLCS